MILYNNEHKPKKIYIKENKLHLLSEDVFISGLKRGKANLTYDKRANTNRIRNMGNVSSFDMLDTGKMDQNDNDTFIVPLKGGINSYNITSIKGTEVMHYFKNKWNSKKTKIDINVEGQKTEYELMMEDSEFKEFLNVFVRKVSNVVNYVTQNLAKSDKNFQGFNGVSIYPVPSSSNFNEKMAEVINTGIKISNLPARKIDTSLFKKDLSNLQKDTNFINKNKEYYNGKYFKNSDIDNRTHIDLLDDTIRKYGKTTEAQDESLINNYNYWVGRVITSYNTKSSPKTITKNYEALVACEQEIRKKLDKSSWKNAFKYLKYAKGPSIDKRTNAIHDIVSSVNGKTYIQKYAIPIVKIEKKDFQIKNLTNDIRMGLKNYFKAEDNIQEELRKIEGTVFLIFDDNISGGATLSDICYQAKELGIKYIIPITFGQMRTKYSLGTMKINAPEKWNF